MRRNSPTVAVRLVVSNKALINLVLVVEILVVIVATVAVRVATDSRLWAVEDARLAMASAFYCL